MSSLSWRTPFAQCMVSSLLSCGLLRAFCSAKTQTITIVEGNRVSSWPCTCLEVYNSQIASPLGTRQPGFWLLGEDLACGNRYPPRLERQHFHPLPLPRSLYSTIPHPLRFHPTRRSVQFSGTGARGLARGSRRRQFRRRSSHRDQGSQVIRSRGDQGCFLAHGETSHAAAALLLLQRRLPASFPHLAVHATARGPQFRRHTDGALLHRRCDLRQRSRIPSGHVCVLTLATMGEVVGLVLSWIANAKQDWTVYLTGLVFAIADGGFQTEVGAGRTCQVVFVTCQSVFRE